jgi:hypothetical protein
MFYAELRNSPGDQPSTPTHVRLMRIELAQRPRNGVQQFLGLRSVAALILETFDAKPKFADAIFSLRNPLGNLQEIRRNSPH